MHHREPQVAVVAQELPAHTESSLAVELVLIVSGGTHGDGAVSAEEQISTLQTGDAFGGLFAQLQARFFHKEENYFVFHSNSYHKEPFPHTTYQWRCSKE